MFTFSSFNKRRKRAVAGCVNNKMAIVGAATIEAAITAALQQKKKKGDKGGARDGGMNWSAQLEQREWRDEEREREEEERERRDQYKERSRENKRLLKMHLKRDKTGWRKKRTVKTQTKLEVWDGGNTWNLEAKRWDCKVKKKCEGCLQWDPKLRTWKKVAKTKVVTEGKLWWTKKDGRWKGTNNIVPVPHPSWSETVAINARTLEE